jgi:hypothetical protein
MLSKRKERPRAAVAIFLEKRHAAKTFILPVKNLTAGESEMNAFLRSHRGLAVRKEFVADGENSFWSFCVEYLESQVPTNGGAGGKPPKLGDKEGNYSRLKPPMDANKRE